MGRLQGKIAVITAGTQGIGLATAKLIVRERAEVFVTGRRQKELEKAVASIDGDVAGLQGDVSNLAEDRRIRSNVLSPGPLTTPQAALQVPDAIARIVSTVPMGGMTTPEGFAKVALFLGSDDSSFVTGIELFADGGRAQI